MNIKLLIKKHCHFLLKYRNAFNVFRKHYCLPKFGYSAGSAQIGLPIIVTRPQNVFLYEKTRINPGAKIITCTGKVIVKKYTGIAFGCTIVTGNHTPTVGFPQTVLGHSHMNDKERDIVIEEDVWIGANVTILSGAHISRGCVIGACSLVNKEIPPYAVVVGTPAKIIASKFTLEQILEHEQEIYTPTERFTREYLEDLFLNYYNGIRSIGLNG